MFIQKNENDNSKAERMMLLTGTVIGYFLIFTMIKLEIINMSLGFIILIFLYMYLDFNLTNIYFTSKRTTFKIYIFMVLEIMLFFMTAFTMMNILIYFIGLGILYYLMTIDEGKNESVKIYRFLSIYTLIKVIFTLTWIFF